MKVNKKILNKIFNILIVYYWFLAGYIVLIPNISEIVMRILSIVPISVFIVFSSIFIKNKKIKKPLFYIIGFILLGVLSSLLRLDYNTTLNISLLSLTIFIIYNFTLTVNLNLLNKLFLISILLSIPLYYMGFILYGFYPGQAQTHHLESLNGRVAMFNSYSLSVYFSIMVFIYNFYFSKKTSKIIILSLSLYYIFFGVSRTGLIILFIIILLNLFKPIDLNKSNVYKFIIPFFLLIVTPTVFIYIEDIIKNLLLLNNDFVSSYFFRGYDNYEKVLEDTGRISIWVEHINIFNNTLIGASSTYIEKYMISIFGLPIGSESFFTNSLAKYGIAAFALFLFFINLLIKSIQENDIYLYSFFWIFLFIGSIYGSFFSPTNMLFLIFISSINQIYKGEKT